MLTRKCVFAKHLHLAVLEIEGLMRSCDREIDETFIIGNISDGGVDGRLVIRGVCDRGVGQSGKC